MNRLCFDEFKNLVLEYHSTGDTSVDSQIENWLELADYIQKDGKWIFPKTADIVRFLSIAKQTIGKFEKEHVELDVCQELDNVLTNLDTQEDDYEHAIEEANKIKNDCPICEKQWSAHDREEMKICQEQYTPQISSKFTRTLKPYQKVAVDHLLAVGN